MHVDTAVGGFIRTVERRTLDWKPQVHKDYIFGRQIVLSRLIEGKEDSNGKIRPALQLYAKYSDGLVYDFLTGAVSATGAEDVGFLVEVRKTRCSENGNGSWIHTVSRHEDLGTLVEQVRMESPFGH